MPSGVDGSELKIGAGISGNLSLLSVNDEAARLTRRYRVAVLTSSNNDSDF